MRDALLALENHSVPVKKLPIRRDGATEMTTGWRPAGSTAAAEGTSGPLHEAR